MSDQIRVGIVKYPDRDNLVLRYKNPLSGKTVCRSAGTANRKDAAKAAGKWEAELREGRYKIPTKATWDDFRERYAKERLPALARQTGAKIDAVFNTVERILDPARLGEITTERLSYYQAQLRTAGRSESTIASHLRHIQAALNWAAEMGLLVKAPKIQRPPRAKGGHQMMKGRPITGEEFDRMLAAVPKALFLPKEPEEGEGRKPEPELTPEQLAEREEVVESWRRFLRGLWLSGLRLEESLELYWDRDNRLCVDLSGKYPMLRIPAECEKGFKDRLLPIVPDFAEFLLETPEHERRGHVFKLRSRRGESGQLTKDRVCHIITKIGTTAGVKVATKTKTDPKTRDRRETVKYASAHDLRRSFGVRWSAKIMPHQWMELMRHESIETTNRYYVGRNAQTTAQLLWEKFGGQEKGQNAAGKGLEGNILSNNGPDRPESPVGAGHLSPNAETVCDIRPGSSIG